MRAALANLNSSLGNVRDLINEIVANTGAALANPQVRIRHETQQCGSVVLMTGYFEAFLKDVVRAFIDQLCQSTTDFSGLPDVIQNTHYEVGGRVLTEVSRARRNSGFTPLGTMPREDVAERLYSPAFSVTAKSYVILWEAFADTRSNPNPGVVAEIAKGLGMKNVWPTIAAKSGSGHSDSTLSSRLQNLIVVRNSCAHTGTVAPIPTTADILNHLQNLEWIAAGLVQALEDELTNY